MTAANPPRWTECTLALLLAPQDRDTVTGDLLEEYRESIYPERGPAQADLWYFRHVAGFAWRAGRTWAALLSSTFVARTALDWFVPPADFHGRAGVLTGVIAATFLAVGFSAAWRSGSSASGAIAGFITSVIAATSSIVAATALLAIWHDPETLAAIEASGGLAEVFTLPLLLIVPGTLLGAMGGLLNGGARRILARAP